MPSDDDSAPERRPASAPNGAPAITAADASSPAASRERGGLRRWLQDAFEFVYPPGCLWCGQQRSARSGFCDACRGELIRPGGPWCERCSAPVGPHLQTSGGCVHCRSDRFAFRRAVALGAYNHLLRAVCLRAQQERSGVLGGRLGELLVEMRGADLQSFAPDVIVPVPDHWTTRLARVSSVPVTLAWSLGRMLNVPVDLHILRKRRRTAPQSSLPPLRRRHNLLGAFGMVHGVRLESCRVLLVDDVLTTGTTAHRAAEALVSGGAQEVLAAVVARGLGSQYTS